MTRHKKNLNGMFDYVKEHFPLEFDLACELGKNENIKVEKLGKIDSLITRLFSEDLLIENGNSKILLGKLVSYLFKDVELNDKSTAYIVYLQEKGENIRNEFMRACFFYSQIMLIIGIATQIKKRDTKYDDLPGYI